MKKIALFFAMLLFWAPALAAANTAAIEASDVDDKIDIYVDGDHQQSCEWDGSDASCGIRYRDASGVHKIRFKLTNYVYSGPCFMGSCGKYSARLSISLNGDRIWGDYISRRDNSSGIKYDETITCDFDKGKCFY